MAFDAIYRLFVNKLQQLIGNLQEEGPKMQDTTAYPPFLEVPYDTDENEDHGYFYTKSFSLQGEEDSLVEFFDKYGFVIVREVLSPEECEATVTDIWNVLEANSDYRMNASDPSSWNNWPKSAIESHGENILYL